MSKNDNRQFAVLGLGRFGMSMAKVLSDQGYDVLVCDEDPDLVQDAAAFATHAVTADVADENDLDNLGIGNFEVVIIAIGTNFEAALLATMIAKEKGAGYVLVKANGPRQKKILISVGADRVVLPEIEMAERIAISLVTSNIFEQIHISEDYSIAEVAPLKEWIGKTLMQAHVRGTSNLNVLAIKTGEALQISPTADHIIVENDILIVLGSNEALEQFI